MLSVRALASARTPRPPHREDANIRFQTAPDRGSEQSPSAHRLEGRNSTSAAASQLGFMLAGAQWRDSWLWISWALAGLDAVYLRATHVIG